MKKLISLMMLSLVLPLSWVKAQTPAFEFSLGVQKVSDTEIRFIIRSIPTVRWFRYSIIVDAQGVETELPPMESASVGGGHLLDFTIPRGANPKRLSVTAVRWNQEPTPRAIAGIFDAPLDSFSQFYVAMKGEQDQDDDGYYASIIQNSSSFFHFVPDCDDSNPNVHPGQSIFSPFAAKGGSWDFDCDGEVEHEIQVMRVKTRESIEGCHLIGFQWIDAGVPGCGNTGAVTPVYNCNGELFTISTGDTLSFTDRCR